jgi:8-oxo-dGTP pyrophosphatase MutT (NUDIX family)
MTDDKCRAAGIVIFKKDSNDYKMLALLALPKFQQGNRIYDIPKGKLDPNETPFECAKRECWEEVGIIPDNIIAGPHKESGIWTWVAECNDVPILGVNPTTGQQEHLGYTYVTSDIASSKCLSYLKNAIIWAYNTVKLG